MGPMQDNSLLPILHWVYTQTPYLLCKSLQNLTTHDTEFHLKAVLLKLFPVLGHQPFLHAVHDSVIMFHEVLVVKESCSTIAAIFEYLL